MLDIATAYLVTFGWEAKGGHSTFFDSRRFALLTAM